MWLYLIRISGYCRVVHRSCTRIVLRTSEVLRFLSSGSTSVPESLEFIIGLLGGVFMKYSVLDLLTPGLVFMTLAM